MDPGWDNPMNTSDTSNVVVRFVPCELKKPVTDELVHGRALRRNDGCLMATLDLPTGDAAFERFIHGRFVGREEERNRTRQFFTKQIGVRRVLPSHADSSCGGEKVGGKMLRRFAAI